MSEKNIRNRKRFDVALSFPGEYRSFIEEVAKALAQQLASERVFYDKWYEAELARLNLDVYLQSIYRNDTELIVVFLCAAYEKKEWCGLEWRAIRDLIKQKQDEAIMLIRFDETPISGLFGIDGYVDATNREPVEIGKLILERLAIAKQTAQTTETDDLASEKGVIYTKLCNFLANKNWYLADQETYEVMIQALGKQSGKTFGREELLNFPCTDIQTIDRLWVKYSGGRFGFSVQKRIYVECGARLDGEYPDPEIWHTFCKRVGWQLNGKSVEAMFDLSAPLGHLPFKDKQVNLCFAPSGNYNSYDLLPNALLSHQGL